MDSIQNNQSLFQALADPTRREILSTLNKGSKSAGEIAEQFDITRPSLSHHFNILKAAGLVRSSRNGQSIIYTLNTSVVEDAIRLLVNLTSQEEA